MVFYLPDSEQIKQIKRRNDQQFCRLKVSQRSSFPWEQTPRVSALHSAQPLHTLFWKQVFNELKLGYD